MKLIIGGGVNEHGRNCFYIEGKQIKILLDAGLAGDENNPYPSLTTQQLQECHYLFLSHSHKDHSGALYTFHQLGFRGIVVASLSTFRQLAPLPCLTVALETQCQAEQWHSLQDGLSFCWGYSGHCEGSVWFHIQLEDKTILYSGDYHEENPPYLCTPLRNKVADLSLLDCAYGKERKTRIEYLIQLQQLCLESLKNKKRLLLPVPAYGRGESLFQLFQQWFVDKSIKLVSTVNEVEGTDVDILLLKDAQLQKEENQRFATQWLKDNHAILLTGECDKSSFTYHLLKSNQVLFQRYPVHMNYADVSELIHKNNFRKIVLFHSSQFNEVIQEGCVIPIEHQQVIF